MCEWSSGCTDGAGLRGWSCSCHARGVCGATCLSELVLAAQDHFSSATAWLSPQLASPMQASPRPKPPSCPHAQASSAHCSRASPLLLTPYDCLRCGVREFDRHRPPRDHAWAAISCTATIHVVIQRDRFCGDRYVTRSLDVDITHMHFQGRQLRRVYGPIDA